MIPNWKSTTAEDALIEAARYLSRIRPLGAEPKIQGATKHPDMFEASWYAGSGQVAAGIAIRKIPVHMLRGLPSPVQMAAVDRQVFFASDPKSGDYRVVSLYDATFPPLDAIFKRAFELPALSVQRKEMLEILKSAKLADINVVLEVQGSGLRVKVDHVGNQSSLSLFDFESFVEFTGKVPEGILGFAVGLLHPAVQHAASNELTVYLKPSPRGAFDPLGISDSNYQVVVMPIRL